MPPRRSSRRRILLIAISTAFLTILILPLVGPMGPGAVGGTFCYPLIGPIQRLDHSLKPGELMRVQAHEDAHAAQCRREGAIWHNLRRVVPSQRLQAESEAYCAEVRQAVSQGASARLEYARVRDELQETAWFRRHPRDELSAALSLQCPELASRAAAEEAEWNSRLMDHPKAVTGKVDRLPAAPGQHR